MSDDARDVALLESEFDSPPRKKCESGELDMTPMVDVTFLLLIFFMVTASFSLQKSIEVPQQKSDSPSQNANLDVPPELESIEVQIDEYGGFLVLAPSWERETPGKQSLLGSLNEAIAGTSDGMRLVVKVHESARLQSLVDCLDAGTIAGYTETRVTQVAEFN